MNIPEETASSDSQPPSILETVDDGVLIEAVQNGVAARSKISGSDVADVEEPLAMRLVEEAVEEAVEEVSRMTIEQKREQARELEELRQVMEAKAKQPEVKEQSDLEMLGTVESGGDAIEEQAMVETLTMAEPEPAGESPETIEVQEPRKEEIPSPQKADVKSEKEQEPPDEYMDILGNGCLRKKTLVPGNGRESRPLHGDTVTLSFVSSLTETGQQIESDEVTFVVGDGDVMQALDLAVALTELNEEFELITDPKFAYGALGLEPNIPPNASLTITAKLIRTDEPPAYDAMPWSRLVAAANQKRERGNFLFGRNEFALSINSYNKALEILNSRRPNDVSSPAKSSEGDSGGRQRTDSETDESQTGDVERYENFRDEIMDTKVKIYNNLAAAQIRVEAYEAAVNSCDEVLRLSPDNVKAWFRRGKAKAGKGEYSESVRSLRNALKYDSESRIVQNELKRVLALIKTERETQQRIYRRMFGAAANESEENPDDSGPGVGWRRYLWYGAGVAAVGMSVALASAAFKYHQQHT